MVEINKGDYVKIRSRYDNIIWRVTDDSGGFGNTYRICKQDGYEEYVSSYDLERVDPIRELVYFMNEMREELGEHGIVKLGTILHELGCLIEHER